MKGTSLMYFTIRQNKQNYWWYWRMLSGNREIIANGEGYTTKDNCLHAIALVDGGRNLPIYQID
jgi:uncharacterized protein YegP (UPF0339 family)